MCLAITSQSLAMRELLSSDDRDSEESAAKRSRLFRENLHHLYFYFYCNDLNEDERDSLRLMRARWFSHQLHWCQPLKARSHRSRIRRQGSKLAVSFEQLPGEQCAACFSPRDPDGRPIREALRILQNLDGW
jgi:hypothetical protein